MPNDRELNFEGRSMGYGAQPDTPVESEVTVEQDAAETAAESPDRATEADPATTPSGREEAAGTGDVGGGAGVDTGGGGDATGDGDDRDEPTFGDQVRTLRQDVREGLEGLGGGVGDWFKRHPHITEYAPIGVAGASIMAVGSLLSKSFADVPVIGGLLGGLVGGGVKIVGAGLLIFAGANILIREGFGFSSGGDGRVPNTPILDTNSVTADPNLPAIPINRGPADQIFEAADERLGLDNSYAQRLEEEGKVAEANLMREQISTTRQMLNEQRALLREDNLTPEQQERLLASTALAGGIARMPRNEAIDFERLSRDGIASVSAVGDIKNLLAANPDLISQATVMRDSDGDGLDNKVIGREGVDAIMASGAIRVETSDILGNGIEINSQTAVRNALVQALRETVGDEVVIEPEVSVEQAVNVDYEVPELRNPAVTLPAPNAGSTPDEERAPAGNPVIVPDVNNGPILPEPAEGDNLPEDAAAAYRRASEYRPYVSTDQTLNTILATGQLPQDIIDRVQSSDTKTIPIGSINGDEAGRRFEAVLSANAYNYELVILNNSNPDLPAESRDVDMRINFDVKSGSRDTTYLYPEGTKYAQLSGNRNNNDMSITVDERSQTLTAIRVENARINPSSSTDYTLFFPSVIDDSFTVSTYDTNGNRTSSSRLGESSLAAATREFEQGGGTNVGGNRGDLDPSSREAALASIARD